MQTDAGSGASLVSIPFPPLSCLERLLGRMAREDGEGVDGNAVWCTRERAGSPSHTSRRLAFALALRCKYGRRYTGRGKRWKEIGRPERRSVASEVHLLVQLLFITPTSDQARLRPELKHITKGRKRN